MKRRHFLAAGLAWPAIAHGQASTLGRLAIISPSEPLAIMSARGDNAYYRTLFEELQRLGHVEGKTLTVDRYSREKATTRGVEAMIAEAVQSRPDVIYAIGAGTLVKAATTTIPVVALTGDPIALGLAQSLARPGGNFTGVSVDTGPALYGKRIELLREIAPAGRGSPTLRRNARGTRSRERRCERRRRSPASAWCRLWSAFPPPSGTMSRP